LEPGEIDHGFRKKIMPAHVGYDILWKADNKYLLKHTLLDRNYKNPTDDIVVMVYKTLRECLAAVIGRFRNMEIENRVYKQLQTVVELDECYTPLIDELLTSITKSHTRSFSFFGHLCKYKPQDGAKQFLRSLGIFVLTTKRPHLYVLHDFVMKEAKHLPK
jgi:hypothetical protein